MGRALRIFSPIMSLFGGGSERSSTPTVLTPPPPPPEVKPAEIKPAPEIPTKASEPVKKASEDERKRAAAAFGRNATILTSPQGLSTSPNTAKKTLLGS